MKGIYCTFFEGEIEMRNKALMFKLSSGRYIKKYGSGFEQYNLINYSGNYYGVILNSGMIHNISLENYDTSASKYTDKIDNVLLIYFEDFNETTNITAIAENTTVYRKIQNNEHIASQRIFTEPNGKEIFTGYHTVTSAENMHILNEKYISITIPSENKSFFRAQRASLKNKYNNLREYILEKVNQYLSNNEEDLQYEQIINSTIPKNSNSSLENLSFCETSNGNQINKKPWVSKKALLKANFTCEFDSNHKTFVTEKGNPYMEGHHLIRCTIKIGTEIWEKYKRNIDTESNIVSLCPNCHRQVHFGNKDKKITILERLYNKKRIELENNGIYVTFEKLKKLYNV
jgi:5-methylcytosine-specific restriction protein A